MHPWDICGGWELSDCFYSVGVWSYTIVADDVACEGQASSDLELFLESIMFSFSQFLAICSTLDFRSSRFGAQTKISSTIFLAHRRPSMMASERRHHLSEDAFRP